jgi:hypothetical protein
MKELREALWSQFGASIDMLENAISLWPDAYWDSQKRFFYIAYHTLVFLDYYLTTTPENFKSSLPFTLTDEFVDEALDDVIPDKIYSKQELLEYAKICRARCEQVVNQLTMESISDRWVEVDGGMNYGRLEILLYNMRHVQHHAAQLNMLLRQTTGTAPKWVGRGKK